jgi:hypothetical protein
MYSANLLFFKIKELKDANSGIIKNYNYKKFHIHMVLTYQLFNIEVENEPVRIFINIERISIAVTVTRISNKTTSSTMSGRVGTTTTDKRNIPFSITRSPKNMRYRSKSRDNHKKPYEY